MDFSLDTLLMPFRFGFMLNAFYISLLVAVPTAMLSCFLVLKGWARWETRSAMQYCPASCWLIVSAGR